MKSDLKNSFSDSANNSEVQEEPISFKDFDLFREKVKAALENISDLEFKAKIIAKVVQKILVFEDGIEIFFHGGRSQYIDSSNLSG